MPDPAKKEGSGKGGALKKQDYAWHAVLHFFPDSSHDEKLRMFRGIMNSTAEVVPCPDELLEAIEALDPLYQEDFHEMKKLCSEQKKRQQKVKAPEVTQTDPVDPVPVEPVKIPDPSAQEREISTEAPASETAEPRTAHVKADPKLYTPEILNTLIPGRGNLKSVYIKRLPGDRKMYQGFYPGL
eukprot:Skav217040  [mRNA]  locus=scaffold3292:42399:42950:+ [translate_table: standard]